MCTPLAIAGIALTVGSTVANTIGANKAAKARDQALAAERIRQGGLDREAQALNSKSQDSYQDFEGQQTERSGQLGDYFADQKIEAANQNAEASQAAVLPQSGSALTVREEAGQRADADAFTDQQGASLGNLRAFGDLVGTLGRGQARDAMSIGQIGGFKRGSANVLPLELDSASQAGGSARMFGDILGLGGQALTSYGLSGGFTSGPKVTTANANPAAGKRLSTGLYDLYGSRVM